MTYLHRLLLNVGELRGGQHWVIRSLVQCIFIPPMSLYLKETFNEFFEL